MDLVPTLEEYDCFLSLLTLVIWVYWPLAQPCYRKRLAELLGLKMLTMVVLILTSISWVYRPSTQPRYRQRLAELLGLKTLIVDVLIWYGSGLGGSIPLDFLIC